jgi:hypothetical protein
MSTFAWAGLLAASLLGCSVKHLDSSGQNNGAATGSLREATVPASFDFALSRAVTLTVNADPSLFDAKGVAGIEVKDLNNKLLFRGPIRTGQAFSAGFNLSTHDDTVNVTFRRRGVEQTSSVSFSNNTASHLFQ